MPQLVLALVKVLHIYGCGREVSGRTFLLFMLLVTFDLSVGARVLVFTYANSA